LVVVGAIGLVGIGVGAATGLVANSSETTSDASKATEGVVQPRDEHAAMTAELLAGHPVVVIGDRGKPRWYDNPVGGPVEFGESPIDGGVCHFQSFPLTLLHLLTPPIDRYRVEVELRQVDGKNLTAPKPFPSVGLFLGLHWGQAQDGWTDYQLLSVGYTDRQIAKNLKQPATSDVIVDLVKYTHPPEQRPGRHPHEIYRQPFNTDIMFPGQWRKLSLEVESDRVSVSWYLTLNKPEPLVTLNKEQIDRYFAKHNRVLKNVGPIMGHAFTPHSAWSPRQGIGIWAEGAALSVRNFKITPLLERK
jgi:hypothetical protein